MIEIELANRDKANIPVSNVDFCLWQMPTMGNDRSCVIYLKSGRHLAVQQDSRWLYNRVSRMLRKHQREQSLVTMLSN